MRLTLLCLIFVAQFAVVARANAAETTRKPSNPANEISDIASGISRSKQSVQVPHVPTDVQISSRLQRILEATDWFTKPIVVSREGIVTLKGTVQQKAQKDWAENLARDTEGVVAVINSIEVPTGEWFDIRPAEQETRGLIKRALSFTPYLLASILVLMVVAFAAVVAVRVGRKAAKRRFTNSLMIELVAKMFALPVILLGLYLVLRISGLTGVAVTVVGGTGALGLVAGFALKNILENYFSGVMLSISNPYSVGDSIIVNGKKGVVQTLTTRGTVLVDDDGNHVIIPNSTIYATTVVNETTNPSTRVTFQIGISYDESPKKVRELILSALKEAKDVLGKPDSLVLMTSFGASAIIYEVRFWIDSRKSSGSKMKSLVMELVRLKLGENNVKIPGEVREIIFPNGEAAPIARTTIEKSHETREHLAETETSLETADLLNEASKGRSVDHGAKLL